MEPAENSKSKKILIGIACAVVVAGILAWFGYVRFFGAPQANAPLEKFAVPLNFTDAQIIAKLGATGFIKSSRAFEFVFYWDKLVGKISAGGYNISKSMSPWQIANILAGKPELKWVVIPEGLRKEEIADLLGKALGWDAATKQKWLTADTTKIAGYEEGVYFPDTYLIPINETPPEVAARLQNHFQEKFAPFAKEAAEQNIKWDTALKLASIIQREAAGADDMPIISGVLWNRLLLPMRLDVDATVQYARGNTGDGWWAKISMDDKKIKSPYNTFIYKGLPPAPICNPGIEAISSALNPATTTCLYYLHDKNKQIHCAGTFEEHKQNIAKYLQ